MFKSFSDDNAKHYILLVLGIMSCFTYIVYGEAYGQGMSVSRKQRRRTELQHFSPTPSALPPADWNPLAVSLAIHNMLYIGMKSAILNCFVVTCNSI